MKYLQIDKPPAWSKWALRILSVSINCIMAILLIEKMGFGSSVFMVIICVLINFFWGWFEMRENWRARRRIKYEAIQEYLRHRESTERQKWNDHYASIHDIDHIMTKIIKKP